ncbi:MAG: SUMF1/EgtB/PvdO family nonheme iron enzyme [Planctomycetota bacterium]
MTHRIDVLRELPPIESVTVAVLASDDATPAVYTTDGAVEFPAADAEVARIGLLLPTSTPAGRSESTRFDLRLTENVDRLLQGELRFDAEPVGVVAERPTNQGPWRVTVPPAADDAAPVRLSAVLTDWEGRETRVLDIDVDLRVARTPSGFEPYPGSLVAKLDGVPWFRHVVHPKSGVECVLVVPENPDVAPIYIGRTEVTNEQWERVRPNVLDAPKTGPDHPRTMVNLVEASEFCSSIGARLPSVDEWLLAATDGGRIVGERAWAPTDDGRAQAMCASKEPFAVDEVTFDRSGDAFGFGSNVAEICTDDVGGQFVARVRGGGSDYNWKYTSLRESPRQITSAFRDPRNGFRVCTGVDG